MTTTTLYKTINTEQHKSYCISRKI